MPLPLSVVKPTAGGGGADVGGSPGVKADAKPGRIYTQEKYDHIASLTDCAELQSWINGTMDAHDAMESVNPVRQEALDYAQYVDAQMREIGCFR